MAGVAEAVLEIRRAQPGDAVAIARIHVNSWRAAYRGIMPDEILDGLSVTDRRTMWSTALTEAPDPLVWVAARGSEVLGFCAVSAPSRDEDAGGSVAEIAAIYIDPPAWRGGAGRALMGAALTELRRRLWDEVTLWVLADNLQALSFYERFGFAADGAEQRYPRSNSLGIRLRAELDAADLGQLQEKGPADAGPLKENDDRAKRSPPGRKSHPSRTR